MVESPKTTSNDDIPIHIPEEAYGMLREGNLDSSGSPDKFDHLVIDDATQVIFCDVGNEANASRKV